LSRAGQPLDFDAPPLAIRVGRQQVETGVVGQAGRAGKLGCVNVLDDRTGRFLKRPGQRHGHFFGLQALLLLIGRIYRRDDQGVGDEGDLAGADQFGFAPEDGDCLSTAACQLSLLSLDPIQLSLGALFACPGLLGLFCPGRCQLGLLIVEPPPHKPFPLGKCGQHLVPPLDGHPSGNAFHKEGVGLVFLPTGVGRQSLRHGRQSVTAPEQQEVFDRAEQDFGPFILLHTDQAAFEDFVLGKLRDFRIALALDRNQCQMKKIGLV